MIFDIFMISRHTACRPTGSRKQLIGRKSESSDAGIWDAEEMAEFYKKNFEGQWQVTAVKDREYYQTMILEQQSEHGGVRLLRQSGDIVGMYAYAAEDELEVRELLCLDGFQEEILNSVAELKVNRKTESEKDVKVYGCPEELASGKRPLIMARIVCFRRFCPP